MRIVERPYDEADRRALIELFGSDGSARWLGAWPTDDQVPESLFAGYLQAIEETHHLASGRPTGWPSFESGFSPGGVPTARDLHAAYQLLRFDVTLSTWSGVQWWAFLLTGMSTVFFYARMCRRSGVLTALQFYAIRHSCWPAAIVRGFRAVYLGLFFNIMIMATVNLAAAKILRTCREQLVTQRGVRGRAPRRRAGCPWGSPRRPRPPTRGR